MGTQKRRDKETKAKRKRREKREREKKKGQKQKEQKPKTSKQEGRKKDHGSGMSIASLQALLSIASSLGISYALRSLLTDSSQVKLGRPLPLLTLASLFRTPLRTGASGGLRWTCPNHLNRC
ncbi:hypothetical protein QOZ80_2BG0171650 [Eleusine coracana subsp. coracana]|nr:hypothetical protein QOZ80_2BG0171650 [Eleusine coracana subsp. coracana]